ncbi:MAG: carbon-nitrogen hydrolase family protein [bacterium]
MRSVDSFEEFQKQCRFFIDTASDYRCDIMVFPELFTNQLMSLVAASKPNQTARELDVFTTKFIEFFTQMAIKYNVNIVGGTHLTVEDGVLYNISYLFHRDGRIDKQYKLHITPSEAQWWGVTAGHRIDVFETDCGPIAILICYDSEFPEIARIATSKGARILFIPFNTDIRSGYLRVRSCAQARAIENHVYVVMSGAIGNLPEIDGSDIHYAQSAILTPSDIEFARDGVAAETTANVETMLVHDLDMALLRRTRRTGTVRTVIDRRRDLYSIVYHGDEGEEYH